MSLNNTLKSITSFTCPKCHRGHLYPTSFWSFRKMFTMNDQCSHCGQAFELEPGFYWGAMYIGYAISSGTLLATVGILYFGFGWEVTPSLLVGVSILVIFYGLVFRLARSIWIHLYVNYDEKADRQPELYKDQNK